jgi:hypothetical protein
VQDLKDDLQTQNTKFVTEIENRVISGLTDLTTKVEAINTTLSAIQPAISKTVSANKHKMHLLHQILLYILTFTT